VAFANYVYNTAQGGGISTTVSRHTAIAARRTYARFDVQGEVAVSAMWAQSFANPIPGVGARNQYGVETFWNIGRSKRRTAASQPVSGYCQSGPHIHEVTWSQFHMLSLEFSLRISI